MPGSRSPASTSTRTVPWPLPEAGVAVSHSSPSSTVVDQVNEPLPALDTVNDSSSPSPVGTVARSSCGATLSTGGTMSLVATVTDRGWRPTGALNRVRSPPSRTSCGTRRPSTSTSVT